MKRLAWLLAAVVGIELIAVTWIEQEAVWKAYQTAFFQIGALQAEGDSARDWYQDQPGGIYEIEVRAIRRTDRCTTCHLGVEDAFFRAAPEPFRTHPVILEEHPPDEYGCTVCHSGNGRALSTQAAHGESHEAPTRLWRGPYLEAGCYQCHGEYGIGREQISTVLLGRKLVNQMRCLRCHQIAGQGESEGPELSAIGTRRDWVEIFAHLINPQAMSPGSTMPDLPLHRDQAEAITAFLLTLQGPTRAVFDLRYLDLEADEAPSDDVQDEQPDDPPKPQLSFASLLPSEGYRGREIYDNLGCSYCHRIGSRGGEVGPALTFIARARDGEWLRRLLEQPQTVMPNGVMPQMYLSSAQVEALVDYLGGLR